MCLCYRSFAAVFPAIAAEGIPIRVRGYLSGVADPVTGREPAFRGEPPDLPRRSSYTEGYEAPPDLYRVVMLADSTPVDVAEEYVDGLADDGVIVTLGTVPVPSLVLPLAHFGPFVAVRKA